MNEMLLKRLTRGLSNDMIFDSHNLQRVPKKQKQINKVSKLFVTSLFSCLGFLF